MEPEVRELLAPGAAAVVPFVTTSDTLMATASGTVVTIFDTDAFLFKTKQCPHIVTVRPVPDGLQIDLEQASCKDCQTSNELWLCLVCHGLFCGRFANRHMVEHYKATGHVVCMSTSDLSVWCHGCDVYLQHDFFPRLHHFFAELHKLKFREEPKNVLHEAGGSATGHGHSLSGDWAFWDSLGPMGEHLCSHMGAVSECFAKVTKIDSACQLCSHVHAESRASAEGAVGRVRPGPMDALGDCAVGAMDTATVDVAVVGGDALRGSDSFSQEENWMCLTCFGVFCGRYSEHRHMQAHHQNHPNHAVCLSLADWSLWCNNCNSYVDSNVSERSRAAFLHLRSIQFPDDDSRFGQAH